MLSVFWKDYKLLDGSVKRLVQKVGDGSIIIRFEKTPYPEGPNDVVCPHFLELKWANGCPYNCSWCYLKGTFRFWRDKQTGKVPPHFKEYDRIKRHCESFVRQVRTPEILNTGELADSLMGENLKPKPFSVFVQEIFDGSPHKVLYLSKGINVKNFLEHDWQENAILSWSVNEPLVSKTWEKLAPDPLRRLDAARKAQDAGYEIRLRIDPMVPILGYEEKYRRFVDEIFKRGLEPERITLGTLRGLLSTLSNVVNGSWEKFLDKSNMTNWGYKPSDSVREALYENVIEHLKSYGYTRIGICKETISMWRKLGLSFKEITCNCLL